MTDACSLSVPKYVFKVCLKCLKSYLVNSNLNIAATKKDFKTVFFPSKEILTIYFRSGSRVEQNGDNSAKQLHEIHLYMFTPSVQDDYYKIQCKLVCLERNFRLSNP